MPDADSVAARYAARVAAGDIERDRTQERALGRLTRLEEELARYRQAGLVGSLARRLTGGRAQPPRGIYLWGDLDDYAVKLIASAAPQPDRLNRGGEGFEAFEFRRTAARLAEMRTAGYLALPHGRRVSHAAEEAGPVET